MSAPKWISKWEGGRVKQGKDQPVYVLERTRNGRTYNIVLDVTSEADARGELYIFEKDPEAYRAQLQQKAPRGNAELTRDYGLYLQARGLSPRYVKDALHYMETWMKLLGSKPLQAFTLIQLRTFLARQTARRRMIVVLKSFSKFLRVEGLLDRQTDPTADLQCPKVIPAKSVAPKSYARDHIERLYAVINTLPGQPGRQTLSAQSLRDVVLTLALTGCHYSELARICDPESNQGGLEPVALGQIAGVAKFWHKNGRVHAQALDARTLAALQRLRGRVPLASSVSHSLDRIADRNGIQRVNIGALRHSFGTWAKQFGKEIRPAADGIPLATIAAIMGHNAKTNADFYQEAVPALALIPINLIHRDDAQESRGQAKSA